MKYYIINFILMQLGWFACVIGGDLWALPALIVILLLHVTVVCKNNWSEIKFLLIATLLGSVGDTIIMHLGALKFDQSLIIIPIWLICLWAIFATSINHCLSWTRKKPFIAAIMGFLFAPMAYYSGTKFDALELSDNIWFSFISIGVVWAIIMPVFGLISNKLENK